MPLGMSMGWWRPLQGQAASMPLGMRRAWGGGAAISHTPGDESSRLPNTAFRAAGESANRRRAAQVKSANRRRAAQVKSANRRRAAQVPRWDPMCEHGFHPFPDLGRLASLDALRAGSGGLTTYTTTPLELYCHRLRAEV
jgi:hypothetical protein